VDLATRARVTPPRYEAVAPGSFDPTRHYYPRVLNAQIHALVRYFLNLGNERLIARFCHLNPAVDRDALRDLLNTRPRYFAWSGSDLFHATTDIGRRQMVIVETNSCPSGQKSMPLYEEHDDQGGYRELLTRAFLPLLRGNRRVLQGELAVLFDKNEAEASGYAAALADLTGETVHLVEAPDGAENPRFRFPDGVLEIRDAMDEWVPIRAAFRYVTQRPWNRIPVHTKTAILNPVIACLAGGRNKLMAAKAYDFFNADLAGTGLAIRTPETIWDVGLAEVPLYVRKLGGTAVVKNPYSNAGQGVFTITSPEELSAFLDREHTYDRFIVQSLIGHPNWSSRGDAGRLFHVGTMPNKRASAFVADLRMMVSSGDEGFGPSAIYARRARKPLCPSIEGQDSWEVLGTNLSVKKEEGGWASDTDRLLLMDRKDFNTLGLGIDDLIEAFIQSVLATLAVDKMASQLISKRGTLRMKLFRSLDDDDALLEEILT
jgi:hypothetical protein